MRRLIVTVFAFVFAYGAVGMITESLMSNRELGGKDESFQIVGRYKNCDVVRYGQFFFAYAHFLHCSTPQ